MNKVIIHCVIRLDSVYLNQNVRRSENKIMQKPTSPRNILSDGLEEMTLGGRLHSSRQNAGMSLQMVANLLGVRSTTLKSWENDRSEPRVNKLVALAGLLGVSPTHFLAEEGNNGSKVTNIKGSRNKLIEMLKEEISCAREQQKILNEQIKKIDALIQKL